MDKTKKLIDVCVFCYKNVEENVQLGNIDRSQTVDKFCKFLRRICVKRFNVSSSPGQLLATCEACVSIMESFNELYHQVKCLQLQMEWRLDKLKNVMKCADKIPSRVKTFRERYDIPGLMQANGELHGEAFKHLLDIRNVIQLQMTEYLSNVFPHVRLEKRTPKSRHSESNNKIDLKMHQSQEAHLHLKTNPHFTLEWLKTVIGLAMCCFPVVNYNYIAPEFATCRLEHTPEVICVPDSGVISEPIPELKISCKTLDATADKHFPEPITSSSPSSPGHFDDVFSYSPDPIISQIVECIMSEDNEQMNDNDQSSGSNIDVPLEPQVAVPVQSMETEDDSFTSLHQPCSILDTKVICITEPEQVYPQNVSLQQSVVNNSPENIQKQTCTDLQVDEPKLENEIPSKRRQLRSKFKCKTCSLTFSTSTRLNEHSKSCTSTNGSNESDEESSDEDIEAKFSDNLSNFDMSPQASENELEDEFDMEDDSESDYSQSDEEELRDVKPKPENIIKVTETLLKTDSWSLEECLEIYKKPDGQTPLSENNVSLLKLTATDVQLKGFEFLEICKLPGCDSGMFSKDELEYHQSLHGEFKCDLCGFSSNFAIKIILHELEHNSNLENELCPRCPDVKVDAVSYKKHFVERHLETSVSYRCAQCPVCSMSFPETDQVPLSHFVNEHDISRLNDSDKVFDCDEDNCSAYFLTVKQLLDHSKIVHNKTKRFWNGKLVNCLIECDSCSQKFLSASSLSSHEKKKHGKITDPGLTVITDDGLTINDIFHDRNSSMKVPCLVESCKLKFSTEEDRDAHSKHHGTFKCNFCSVEKTFAPDLAVHELEHAEMLNTRSSSLTRTVYKCGRCAYSVTHIQYYINHHIVEHLKLSPDRVTITCPICQQTFWTTCCRKWRLKKRLFVHFIRHHDKSKINDSTSPFACKHCPAYFLTQRLLHVHNKRAHPEQMSICMRFSCDDCNQQFQNRSRLLSHRTNVHHNNDESGYEFICEVENCNKRFEYNSDLGRHSARHPVNTLNLESSTFTPRSCPNCDIQKYFTTQISFDRHLRKHQKFVCKQCVKPFPNYSSFTRHMLRHSGPESWQFTCDICFKKCYCMRELRLHKETHPSTSNISLSGSLDDCLEKYKNTNGKISLSQENIKTLKLTGADIRLRLKYVESSLESCNLSGCEAGLYSTAELEYHRLLHGEFQCAFCDYNTSFAINLIEHEIQHGPNLKNGFCPKCPEVKVNVSGYKKHFVEHHLENSVKYKCALCPVCSKTFPECDQVPLVHFVNEHDISRLNDPEKVFSCNEENCSAYFLTTKQLIAHSKIAHNKTKRISFGEKVVESKFVCDICPRKFFSMSELNAHKKKKHTQTSDEIRTEESDFMVEKFPCLTTSCKHKFPTEKDRNAHSKLHADFKCDFCPVTESFAPDLALHEIRLHSKPTKSLPGKDTFNCSRCEFSSTRRESYIRHHLEKHLRLSPDTFTLNCHICQQPFADRFFSKTSLKNSLLNHFITHHDKTGIKDSAELFNCTHCPAYFLTQLQLHLHNQRMHPEQFPSLSLSCADCNREFKGKSKSRSILLDHRTRVHHNNDDSGYKFICQVNNCNKRFEYEGDLAHHITWHTKYTPKPCPECGKILMNQHNYDCHIKSHHQQGHVCEHCGKKFKYKHILATHMVYHDGPDSWQFICDICSRKCPSKDKLAEHKKVHSKTKPYICDKCGATYAHRHNWRHHMIKIHGVPDFTQKRTKPSNITSRKGMKDQQNVSSKRKKRV